MCFIDLLAATALFLLKIWVSKAKKWLRHGRNGECGGTFQRVP